MQRVASGEDRFGEHRSLGISVLDFKLSAADAGGGLFVVENSFREKGGPARHLHHDQDEWFYALEGEFRFEIGAERTLKPGDSVLGPRGVPHVWASTGAGRILIAFTPAGKMEAFFGEITKANAMSDADTGRAGVVRIPASAIREPAALVVRGYLMSRCRKARRGARP
jgi:quercetin dioxygenase-like cupin family protein